MKNHNGISENKFNTSIEQEDDIKASIWSCLRQIILTIIQIIKMVAKYAKNYILFIKVLYPL